MELFILISSSCTIPRALTCWFNPLNICRLYIKCCHTFWLPFSCRFCYIFPFVCVFACIWMQLDLFVSDCMSRCRGGEITPKTLHCNNSARIHTPLFCDLLKDLFLCWWRTFLLMLTLKTPFWFNIKSNYLGVFVCLMRLYTTLKMSRLCHSNESFGTRHG